VVWKYWEDIEDWEWRAAWFEITNCNPREFAEGEPIANFKFTDDGVKVRVALSDLMTAADPDQPLIWHAGVRRVPFIYILNDVTMKTTAVDYAPDVVEFIPYSPWAIYPEKPATWEAR